MSSQPTLSVIIPTYNRKELLLDCLDSLAGQSYPKERFDVIVVDDGSTDGTEEIAGGHLPFTLHYIRQAKKGDAAARNLAARQSNMEYLVLLDDDMVVETDYLASLLAEHGSSGGKMVVGTEYLWLADSNPLESASRLAPELVDGCPSSVEHPFAEVSSRNMSLRRQDYHAVGLMDGFGFQGSNIWCDVDFAYRAYRLGFVFRRSLRAICYHRDYVARDMSNAKRRAREMSYRAVVMFQKHPDLLPYLPMFQDKTAVAWRNDPPALIAHKLLRPVASSRPILSGMEKLEERLERHHASPTLLRPLRRWILGGYHYRGFRDGMRDFEPAAGQNNGDPPDRPGHFEYRS
ncbi:MAG: glycosyltransferase [Chloroflexota bacterium]|nr:MAG: glycosyltransferase [Chloroflexota bacterium]